MNSLNRDHWKEIDNIIETLAYELDPDGEYNDGTFKRDIEAKVKADKTIRKLLEKVRQETIKQIQDMIVTRMRKYADTRLSERNNAFNELAELDAEITIINKKEQ